MNWNITRHTVKSPALFPLMKEGYIHAREELVLKVLSSKNINHMKSENAAFLRKKKKKEDRVSTALPYLSRTSAFWDVVGCV